MQPLLFTCLLLHILVLTPPTSAFTLGTVEEAQRTRLESTTPATEFPESSSTQDNVVTLTQLIMHTNKGDDASTESSRSDEGRLDSELELASPAPVGEVVEGEEEADFVSGPPDDTSSDVIEMEDTYGGEIKENSTATPLEGEFGESQEKEEIVPEEEVIETLEEKEATRSEATGKMNPDDAENQGQVDASEVEAPHNSADEEGKKEAGIIEDTEHSSSVSSTPVDNDEATREAPLAISASKISELENGLLAPSPSDAPEEADLLQGSTIRSVDEDVAEPESIEPHEDETEVASTDYFNSTDTIFTTTLVDEVINGTDTTSLVEEQSVEMTGNETISAGVEDNATTLSPTVEADHPTLLVGSRSQKIRPNGQLIEVVRQAILKNFVATKANIILAAKWMERAVESLQDAMIDFVNNVQALYPPILHARGSYETASSNRGKDLAGMLGEEPPPRR